MYDPSSPMLRPVMSGDGVPAPEAKARFAEDRLLDAVIWCEIAPGEIVSEADVMDRFGLTKAAARSGLMRLGYDGWATPQPRTGWRVLSVSGALIGQVLDARRLAEPALADVALGAEALNELEQISRILDVLAERQEAGALVSYNHYLNRVDGILLESINPFTARHLRRLWHHTARITHYLEDDSADQRLKRNDAPALTRALLAGDRTAILAARNALIDAQEAFFLRQLLRDGTPLKRGARTRPTPKNQTTNTNRREA